MPRGSGARGAACSCSTGTFATWASGSGGQDIFQRMWNSWELWKNGSGSYDDDDDDDDDDD